MSLAAYKILHLFGLALVLVALGGLSVHAFRGEEGQDPPKKGLLAATHGVGMLLMIGAGFGMLHALGGGMMPGWIHPKMLLWVILGAAYSVLKRKPSAAMVMWLLIPVIVALGAAIALYKPGA